MTTRPSQNRYKSDYLTSRAVNPRTGLISPSISQDDHAGGNVVNACSTPGSLGEALSLYAPREYDDYSEGSIRSLADHNYLITKNGCDGRRVRLRRLLYESPGSGSGFGRGMAKSRMLDSAKENCIRGMTVAEEDIKGRRTSDVLFFCTESANEESKIEEGLIRNQGAGLGRVKTVWKDAARAWHIRKALLAARMVGNVNARETKNALGTTEPDMETGDEAVQCASFRNEAPDVFIENGKTCAPLRPVRLSRTKTVVSVAHHEISVRNDVQASGEPSETNIPHSRSSPFDFTKLPPVILRRPSQAGVPVRFRAKPKTKQKMQILAETVDEETDDLHPSQQGWYAIASVALTWLMEFVLHGAGPRLVVDMDKSLAILDASRDGETRLRSLFSLFRVVAHAICALYILAWAFKFLTTVAVILQIVFWPFAIVTRILKILLAC